MFLIIRMQWIHFRNYGRQTVRDFAVDRSLVSVYMLMVEM